MSVQVRVAPTPHIWTVLVKKMHLKPGKGTASRHRPDTATLDKPLILDPGLLRKVDMTRLTRERLLTIENLITTPKKKKTSPKTKEKPGKTTRSKSPEGKIDSCEDDESSVVEDFKMRKNSRVLNSTFRVRSHVRKGLREVFSMPTQIQVSSAPEKEPAKIKSPKLKETSQTRADKKAVEDVFGTLIVSNPLVPSPCSTCGRSERPERLHAHPSMPQNKRSKLKDDQEDTVVQQKSTVTKPVAMKFRSGKTRGEKHPEVERPMSNHIKSPVQSDLKEQRKTVPLIRRETFKIERGPKPTLAVEKKVSPVSPSPTRKSSLPVNPPLRRKALPRTPDKEPPRTEVPMPVPVPVPVLPNPPVVHSASPRRPRTITCYLCQKQFGTASYPLHEPQCLQKWHRENQALPAAQQQSEPERPQRASDQEVWDHAWEAAQLQEWESDRDDRSERSGVLEGPTAVHCHICGRLFNRAVIDNHEQQCLKRWQQEHSRDSGSSAPPSATSSPPSSAQSTPRRRLVLCYLCGRQFGSVSIAIHEPQCLRKWRQENERLPQAQRRAEPQKPELVYDSETGRVDYQATEEAQWQCHLVQLVPCGKCGRTFNPDRVIVHEKCCKGPFKH